MTSPVAGVDPADIVTAASTAGPSSLLLGPLGPLLSGAFALFGHPNSKTTVVVEGTAVPEGGVAPATGPAADAESRAASMLSAQTQTLQALDMQMTALANQISDQNAAARAKLTAIKNDVEAELAYIASSGEDNVVKAAAVSKFFATNAQAIAAVISEAAAAVGDNQTQLEQLGNGYNQQQPPVGGGGNVVVDPAAPLPGPVIADPGSYGGGAYVAPPGDPGYGGGPYEPGYDQGYGYGGYGGVDPMAAMSQMLPQMAAMLPGALAGVSPLGAGGGLADLGGVIGSAIQNARAGVSDPPPPSPLPDPKADQPGTTPDEPGHEQSGPPGAKPDDPPLLKAEQPPTPPPPVTTPPGEQPDQPVNGPAASVSETPPPPPPAPSLVKRPDGTSAVAMSPAVASAATAHLGGAPLEDAYRAAGITLPPPGTPVKASLPSLSVAQPGDLAVFRDRYVMLLGDNQVYLDGSAQPASALAKLQGFVAFCHPPAASVPSPAVAVGSVPGLLPAATGGSPAPAV